jgi:hypothetical protein
MPTNLICFSLSERHFCFRVILIFSEARKVAPIASGPSDHQNPTESLSAMRGFFVFVKHSSMSCYVYFLYSEKVQKYYVGISNNVENRLRRHNHGESCIVYLDLNEMMICNVKGNDLYSPDIASFITTRQI